MKQYIQSSIGTNVNRGTFNPDKLPFRKIGEKTDTSYVGEAGGKQRRQ